MNSCRSSWNELRHDPGRNGGLFLLLAPGRAGGLCNHARRCWWPRAFTPVQLQSMIGQLFHGSTPRTLLAISPFFFSSAS